MNILCAPNIGWDIHGLKIFVNYLKFKFNENLVLGFISLLGPYKTDSNGVNLLVCTGK